MVSSSTLAYESIRGRILEGIYPPKHHLAEESIANDIGVSRTPVREALRRLAADGYVTFLPNQGAFVSAWSAESFSELITVRAELAALAARGAAMHAVPSAVEELRAILDDIAAADRGGPESVDRQTRLNIRFHDVILNNCGNRWIAQLLNQTSYVSNVRRAYHAFDEELRQRALSRYRDLIEAFESRDGEWAASIFKSHFLASYHAVLRQASTKKPKTATD